VLPVPLLPQAERVEPQWAIYCKHSVEMIDFVLEQLRAIALHLDFLPITFEILIAHPDAIGARHPNQEVGERKTVVPHLEILVPYVDDFRVDQRPGPIHLDINHPYRRAELGG
jgi:hypothetical protein